MPVDLYRCTRCGKAFVAFFKSPVCPPCAEECLRIDELIQDAINRLDLHAAEEIAAATKLDLQEVTAYLKKYPRLQALVLTRKMCARCGDCPADDGSGYCADCRRLLAQVLGEAAQQLVRRPTPRKKPSVGQSRSVLQEIRQKRTMLRVDETNIPPRRRV
jgi:hypothetical protein